jgi:hypothetical protein
MDRQQDPNGTPPIPRGSGIRAPGWLAAVNEVRNLAATHRRFWDLWVIVYRRHLKRYAGSGCPACGTVFHALEREFDEARSDQDRGRQK